MFTIMATTYSPPPAQATDGAAIASCLFKKCPGYLAKCITNPKCLGNVLCINTCNGKPDEIGCQIKCGDTFENDVVGEFNKCAVSDMTCVPQKKDDGSYRAIPKDVTVPKFDTKFFSGRWYITSGQNALFDIFPCQVHFFEPTPQGNGFVGKLNWKIVEPDGEQFSREAVQTFIQDKDQPGLLKNHDNEFLHYQDDWYVIDYEPEGTKTSPFAFIYYRGSNDAWDGYGGVVVYTRSASLPADIIPRLKLAAEKVGFDYDKDFTKTDNSCKVQTDSERVILREKFAGKALIQSEEQLQQEIVRARNLVVSEEKTLVKEIQVLERKAVEFEREVLDELEVVEEEIESKVGVGKGANYKF